MSGGGVFFHQTAVRVRAGTRLDRAGTPVEDWSEAAVSTLELAGLNIAPRTTAETPDGSGARVVTGWWLQTAPGTDADITAADRIHWGGLVLAVEGDPQRWPDPFTGGVHHLKAALTRATAR